MPSALSERVQNIEESSTLAVDNKAKGLRAAGEPVIGFGAGEPDFPSPAHVVEAAVRAAADPRMHRYSPAGGLPELREAIADKTGKDSGYEVTPEQVLVTNGGKQALYTAFQTLLDPGDQVLLPSPYWVTFPEQIRLAAAEPVIVKTSAETGFRAGVDQLEAAFTPSTRALVFVSPSNPTGSVYAPDEVAAIGKWAAERGVWVVTDEIYQHLVYGDAAFASMPVVAPEIADRCVVVNGVAKTYAMTGWRVGWLIGPEAVVAAAARLQSHLSSNVCNVAQAGALAALTGPQERVEEMRQVFDGRRRVMLEGLEAIPGVVCPEPHGAFYAFPDVSALLGRELAGRMVATTPQLADALLDAAKVAVVPGDGFGAPGCIRLSYALADGDLALGLERLTSVLT